MLTSRFTLFFTLLLAIALCFGASRAGASAAQEPSPEAGRTMTVGGAQGNPSFSLRISASGAQGHVEVRDASGSLVQSLACSLLRDVAHPTSAELEAVRRQFVLNFRSEDLNFDGYSDLQGPREFGAKWGRYCVWLFDPASHSFITDDLAEQMEMLYNLEADPQQRLIIAYSIGPTNPQMDEYRIENASENRPYWPRLIPVDSCLVANNSPGPATAFLTQYDEGRPVIKRGVFEPKTECVRACDCVRSVIGH
jgi:hypothetical protein